MAALRGGLLGLFLTLGAVPSGSAYAAAVFAFQEQAGDVVGTLSGSLDLTGLAGQPNLSIVGAFFSPGDGILVSGEPGGVPATGYAATGPTSIGADSVAVPLRSGMAFALSSSVLFLESSYASDDPISGDMLFSNATFASLGVTPGDHVWTLGNGETFTLRFANPAAVPAPGALPLLVGALGLLGLAGRVGRPRA